MDKEHREKQAADFCSWPDTQALRQQSQWLQTTLSDLDRKINGILSIIVQDDGDSFAKRAEMYYQKRPELIQMVEDLHKSYRSLAEKYEQLRSEVNLDSHPTLLSLPSSSTANPLQVKELKYSHSKSTAEDDEYSSTGSPNNSKMKADDDDEGSKYCSKNQDEEKILVNGIGFQRNTSNNSQAAMLENEKLWNELRVKVSELVEDNLSQQAELIRRNDEKRETIRDLCSKMDMLEHGSKSFLVISHNKVLKKTQYQLSRLKRLFLGR